MTKDRQVRFNFEDIIYHDDEVRKSRDDCMADWYNKKKDYGTFHYQLDQQVKLAQKKGKPFSKTVTNLFKDIEKDKTDADDVLKVLNKRQQKQLQKLYEGRPDWMGLELQFIDFVRETKEKNRHKYIQTVLKFDKNREEEMRQACRAYSHSSQLYAQMIAVAMLECMVMG